MGHNTTLADYDVAKQLVQPSSTISPGALVTEQNPLFIVTNGKLQVTRNNTLFLVITSGVSSQLEDLSGEVLKHGSEVDCFQRVSVVPSKESRSRTRCTGANTLGVVTLLQETMDTTNWELEASLSRTRLLALSFGGRGFS